MFLIRMPGCVAVKTKKYRERPSPPYHAGDCKGKTLTGNDGRKYKSVANAKGVYTWIRVTASVSASENKTRKAIKGTCYKIHDNHSVPHIACIESAQKRLTVTKAVPADPEARKPLYEPGAVIYKQNYRNVFLGDNVNGLKDYERKGTGKGNSILAELGSGRYVFVGEQIYEFHVAAGDVIEAYHSPIGNNDVPYPVAVGAEYLYFLLMGDHACVPRTLFDLKGDLYRQFYDMTLSAASGGKEAVVKPKKFKMKMIRKRWA